MERNTLKTNCTLALIMAGFLAAGPVASQPSWAGGGKGNESEKSQRSDKSDRNDKGNRKGQSDNRNDRQSGSDARSQRDRAGSSAAAHQHFEDRHRTVVREYYSQEFNHGRCPPGLAKKQNGCMPPGQAKKWTIGRPLPRDVIFYNLEPQLATHFGPPPSGHRYVRVASDILLIASGRGTVIDVIQDLGRM